MNVERYDVMVNEDFDEFEFDSVGSKGIFKKIISFELMYGRYYNVSFGDWDDVTEHVDNTARTNNGDRDKILATIAFIITNFLDVNLGCSVYIQGLTSARTRLYQAVIKKFLPVIYLKFKIEGLHNNKWEVLDCAKNYDAFLIGYRL